MVSATRPAISVHAQASRQDGGTLLHLEPMELCDVGGQEQRQQVAHGLNPDNLSCPLTYSIAQVLLVGARTPSH